jgi:hypothetical protein
MSQMKSMDFFVWQGRIDQAQERNLEWCKQALWQPPVDGKNDNDDNAWQHNDN